MGWRCCHPVSVCDGYCTVSQPAVVRELNRNGNNNKNRRVHACSLNATHETISKEKHNTSTHEAMTC